MGMDVGKRGWAKAVQVLEIYRGEGGGGTWGHSSVLASLTDWYSSSDNQESTFKVNFNILNNIIKSQIPCY